MSPALFKDIMALARRRKTFRERVVFFAQGMVFLLFLMADNRRAQRKAGDHASASAAGDDVYPLF